MAKVCCIVLNTIIRDARVLKESESLQKAGHAVTVLGLTDANVTDVKETLPSGVVLSRINTSAARKAAASIYSGLSRIALLVTALFLITTAHINYSFFFWLVVFGVAIAILLVFVFSTNSFLNNWKRIHTDEVDGSVSTGGFIVFLRGFRSALEMFTLAVPLWFAVRRINPDILHCHDIGSLPVGLLGRMFTKRSVVYDAHEIYEEVAQGTVKKAAGYRLIHKYAQRRIDAFITINESIAGWYAKNYPDLPQAVLIKNATRPAGPIKYDGRLHKAANQPLNRKVFLYQGGFARKRGLEYVVQSAAYLSDEWVLIMMGYGRFESTLRTVAAAINDTRDAQGRPEAVVFLPPAPQKDLALWTAGGTIGIIPYENVGLNHWFCTPNKLWEYPNAGVPVLVSPFPELSAPVLKFGYGWLLPDEQDPEALGEMLMGLREAQIVEAKEKCLEFIKSDNWLIYEKRLIDLYENLT